VNAWARGGGDASDFKQIGSIRRKRDVDSWLPSLSHVPPLSEPTTRSLPRRPCFSFSRLHQENRARAGQSPPDDEGSPPERTLWRSSARTSGQGDFSLPEPRRARPGRHRFLRALEEKVPQTRLQSR